MRFLLIIAVFFTLVSCGKKSSDNFITSSNYKFEDYLPYINSINNSKSSEESSIKWINAEYPLELSLFGDNKFHWKLNTLGDGSGDWEFSNGVLNLNSKTHFFDMEIILIKIGENKFLFQFQDRFGFKTIPVTFKNLITR